MKLIRAARAAIRVFLAWSAQATMTAALGMAGTASATIVSYDFKGHVATNYGFQSLPGANTALSGTFSFDNAVTGSVFHDYAPCCGKIYATGNLSLDVGTLHLAAANLDSQFSSGSVSRGTAFLCGCGSSSLELYFDQMSGLASDYRQVSMRLFFNATPTSYAALPAALDLSQLKSTDLSISLSDGSFASAVLDLITPSQVGASALPEPASWAMVIAGFGAVGNAMRRRRSAALAC